MAISKGDLVVVNFTKFGHNVVNAICKVEEVFAQVHHGDKQTVRMYVTSIQGNSTPELGMWTLYCPSGHCMPYLPPVKVGDVVKITNVLMNYAPGGVLPDQRGLSAKITKTTIGHDGVIKYALKAVGHPTSWWYLREAFSTDLEAGIEALVPVPPKPIPKLAVPAIKYKCINPRKTFVSDVGVSNDLL